MPPTWLVIALTVWTLVAIGLGVLIGKGIRNADEQDARLKAAQQATGTPEWTATAAVNFAVDRSTQRRTLPRRW